MKNLHLQGGRVVENVYVLNRFNKNQTYHRKESILLRPSGNIGFI